MAMQSAAMAQAFGANFQYGKRKISAMTNEEFNKLTVDELNHDIITSIKSMIPAAKESSEEMRDFQSYIISEITKYAAQLPKDVTQSLDEEHQKLVDYLTRQAGGDPNIDAGFMHAIDRQLKEALNNILPAAYADSGASGSSLLHNLLFNQTGDTTPTTDEYPGQTMYESREDYFKWWKKQTQEVQIREYNGLNRLDHPQHSQVKKLQKWMKQHWEEIKKSGKRLVWQEELNKKDLDYTNRLMKEGFNEARASAQLHLKKLRERVKGLNDSITVKYQQRGRIYYKNGSSSINTAQGKKVRKIFTDKVKQQIKDLTEEIMALKKEYNLK